MDEDNHSKTRFIVVFYYCHHKNGHGGFLSPSARMHVGMGGVCVCEQMEVHLIRDVVVVIPDLTTTKNNHTLGFNTC